MDANRLSGYSLIDKKSHSGKLTKVLCYDEHCKIWAWIAREATFANLSPRTTFLFWVPGTLHQYSEALEFFQLLNPSFVQTPSYINN